MSKPDFKVNNREIDGNRLSIEVEVASPIVTKAYKKVHKNLLRYIKVPGFRSGKAPMGVVASRVGQDRFDQEVLSELLPKYYYAAVENEERRPVGEVEYKEKKLAKGSPFLFNAEVDIACEIELGDYNSLPVEEIKEETVEDKEIDAQLEALRRRSAKLSEASRDEAIEDGDIVHLRYEGLVDGKSHSALSNSTSLLIGADDLFLGFDEQIKGLKTGEEKSFNFRLPEDYKVEGLEHLASQEVEFNVKVFSVQHADLPEVDDEFAKQVGAFENLGQLKEKLRSDLEENAKQRREKEFANHIREMLAGIVDCELPDERVEKEVERKLDDLKEQLQSRSLSLEKYLEESNKTEESLRAEIEADVRQSMKVDYALDKIALSEGLEVSDEEVDNRISVTAQVLRRRVDEIKEILDVSGRWILQKFELSREKAERMLLERYRIKAGLGENEDSTDKDED